MRLFSRRLGGGLAVAALLGVGYFLGQLGTPPLAAQPGKGVVAASATAPVTPAVPTDKRVIAYVFGNTPITREEYGEYLIQQYGADRVRLYVNRRIIEIAAARRNVIVTPQEVEAVIAQDCGKLGVNRADFVANVLQQKYGKTLQEWRDDVIRPRLILQQMCRDQIKFDEADVKKVFENLYGEKVKCKIILWPSGNEASELQAALKRYASIRKDEKEFDDAARSQLNSDLAARGGVVDPIGRHSGPGTAKIEEIAFQLKDGQLSELITTPGGIMVIKCVGRVPARTDVTFEAVREMLVKTLTERLMEQEIPKMFAEINKEAKPLFLLGPKDITAEEMKNQSKRILNTDPDASPTKGKS